ncbi:hypothetical protein R1sor_000663 [Riccia sorocarpa]|uniref:BTB domain-containing protein n=1 Tax=Riccia sorocarpa TaxID=122646 RepID=A0ABD3GVG5_9MARC
MTSNRLVTFTVFQSEVATNCNYCKQWDRLCVPKRAISSIPEREEHLETNLRFLRAYEVSPLSAGFRGDVEFIGRDGRSVYAHRFILAGRSKVFQRMLDTEMKEKKTGVIRVDDVAGPVLRSMVNYCYTAEIQFTEEAPADELLKVAEKYDIKDLKAVCEDELSKDISKENLSKRITLARLYNAKKLDRMTQQFFKANFDTVYETFVGEITDITLVNQSGARSDTIFTRICSLLSFCDLSRVWNS